MSGCLCVGSVDVCEWVCVIGCLCVGSVSVCVWVFVCWRCWCVSGCLCVDAVGVCVDVGMWAVLVCE